ncbi:hypothetical protein HOLleu_07449 [Holothuria leucospilota]|uniref:Uncharacterized protein n=1 Tax=Holothuria leucospilota TaxID=206669 RepID=A0A9Q1CG10_HOLLE|nr:hypothetical protein HOLleu_07449 [Holothuria leucospilota]
MMKTSMTPSLYFQSLLKSLPDIYLHFSVLTSVKVNVIQACYLSFQLLFEIRSLSKFENKCLSCFVCEELEVQLLR